MSVVLKSEATPPSAPTPIRVRRRWLLHTVVVVLLVCAAFAGGLAVHQPTPSPEPDYPIPVTMYGGHTPSSALDFMVQLEHHATKCVGTLVTSEWVLTAGHCYQILIVGETTVVAGTATPGSGGETAVVDGVVLQPRYRLELIPTNTENATRQFGYDVALVHLARPLRYPTIPLATDTPPPGTTLTALAFHMTCQGTWAGRRCVNPRLQQLDVRTVPATTCAPIAPAVEQCLQSSPGTGPCRGTSGAPIVRQTPSGAILTGVVSRDGDADNAACAGGLAVVSDIAPLRAWITTVTSPGRGPDGLPAIAGPRR